MTNDEEKQIKQALLAVTLSLRRKQEFWETPRNVAILVGASAAIAAAIGFWLGRESATSPAPGIRPAGVGLAEMIRDDQFIDAVQTTGIIVIALLLSYVVVRLERTLTAGAEKLKTALVHQRETLDSLNTIWKRINEIENREGVRQDFVPPHELRTTLKALAQRLDRLEKGDQ